MCYVWPWIGTEEYYRLMCYYLGGGEVQKGSQIWDAGVDGGDKS